ncbi:MAG: hypothetical protein NT137_00525 [Methanomassiliicoccales archaeon]|nr:hypothetical protein [Methanomassiliicoccales archaeon]
MRLSYAHKCQVYESPEGMPLAICPLIVQKSARLGLRTDSGPGSPVE